MPKNKIIPKDSVEVKTLRREMTDTHLVSAKQSGTGLPRNAQQASTCFRVYSCYFPLQAGDRLAVILQYR